MPCSLEPGETRCVPLFNPTEEGLKRQIDSFSDFLKSLGLRESPQPLSPAVQRLMGAGVPSAADTPSIDEKSYRDHLDEKYGRMR